MLDPSHDRISFPAHFMGVWGTYLYADIDGLDRFFDTRNAKVFRISDCFIDVFCAMEHGRQRVADLVGYHINESLLPHSGFDAFLAASRSTNSAPFSQVMSKMQQMKPP